MGNSAALELSALELPSLEAFNIVKKEYDLLKAKGLLNDEIRPIIYELIAGLKLDHDKQQSNVYNSSVAIDQNFALFSGLQTNNLTGYPKFTDDIDDESFILIIDDSAECCKALSDIISLFYSNILFAKSAKNGYDLLQIYGSQIRLIFLDIIMPKTDGLECLSWITADVEVSYIPVYMLTGAMIEDGVLNDICMERGAYGVLTKTSSGMDYDTVRDILLTHNILKEEDNNSITVLPSIVPILHYLPAFQLCDCNYKSFIFPDVLQHSSSLLSSVFIDEGVPHADESSIVEDSVLFIVIPTLFNKSIHSSHGVIASLIRQQEALLNQQIHIICITADLPGALQSAISQYNIPFNVLSDPSQVVCSQLVGCGSLSSIIPSKTTTNKMSNNSGLSHTSRPQDKYQVPNLGLVLVHTANRQVVKRWVASSVHDKSHPADLAVWCRSESSTHTNSSSGDSEIINSSSVVNHANRIPTAPSRDTKPSNTSIRMAKTAPANISTSTTPRLQQSSTDVDNKVSNVSDQLRTNVEALQILYLQDESVSSLVAVRRLEMAGHIVTCVNNAQRAYDSLISKARAALALGLTSYEDLPYSLIMIDVVMPVCDGIELLTLLKEFSHDDLLQSTVDRVIPHIPAVKNEYGNIIVPSPTISARIKSRHERQMQYLSRIPIVVLSGLHGTELSEQCMEIGALAVLSKPFQMEKFTELINNTLGRVT